MDDEAIKQPDTNSELEEYQKKADEYLNNWKRTAADFINYKKDEMERIGMMAKYATQEVIMKVLPIFDSIYLAQKSIAISDIAIAEGLSQITKQIEEFLKKEGIEEIATAGAKFDPNTMEIVEEIEGGESGMIAEELQKGYMIGERVLRPAKVKVIK